jgi:ABC-2 type transport system permease protein
MTAIRPAESVLERVGVACDVMAASARAQWMDMRSSPVMVILGFIQPVVLLLVSLLPQVDPPPAEIARIAFGVLLTSFWAATVWAGAGILWAERVLGTLGKALTGVRDPRLVIVGKSLGASVTSMAMAAATVTLTLIVLRRPVDLGPAAGWLVLGLIAVMLSGTAVGLLIGGIFVLTRYSIQISSALMYPILLVGGMLIPVTHLPSAVRWLSWFISLHWLQRYLTATAAGSPDLGALGLAVGLTVLYAAGGVLVFHRMLDAARRRGTLEII